MKAFDTKIKKKKMKTFNKKIDENKSQTKKSRMKSK